MVDAIEQLRTAGIEIFTAPKGKVRLNPNGLSASEQTLIKDIAIKLFNGAKDEFSHALERCTFFADSGHDVLVNLAGDESHLENPRIEGCDKNPFDQHYWVACDLVRKNERGVEVLFDPIFCYVGLAERADDLLDDGYVRYYQNKRRVKPHKHVSEGGVRIKTIGI